VAAAVGDLINVRVIAEHDQGIAPFDLCLRVRWVKPDAIWQALGGEIESLRCPEGKAPFEKLVAYYAGEGG
jgi:hypothetical protein